MGHRLGKKMIHCYCAFCRLPKRIYGQKSVSMATVLVCLLLAIPMSHYIFGEFNPAILIFFLMFLGVAEATLQVRWRLSLNCKHCGFDPLLYTKAPSLAARKVKSHLERRKNDPSALLAQPLRLTRINKKALDSAGKHLQVSSGPSAGLLSKRT